MPKIRQRGTNLVTLHDWAFQRATQRHSLRKIECGDVEPIHYSVKINLWPNDETTKELYSYV